MLPFGLQMGMQATFLRSIDRKRGLAINSYIGMAAARLFSDVLLAIRWPCTSRPFLPQTVSLHAVLVGSL